MQFVDRLLYRKYSIPNQFIRAMPRRNRNRGRVGASGTSQPTSLRASIQVDKVIRFKWTGAVLAVPVALQDTDLLDLFCVATAANVAYRLSSAMKLRKIEMWVDPVAGGSLASIEDVAASSGVGAPSRILEDTTLGVSRPAHLVWKPAPGSIQGMWISDSSNEVLLLIAASTSGYLDLHISYVLQDGETPVAVSAAVAGATVGQVYIRSLFQSAGVAAPPVSYATH